MHPLFVLLLVCMRAHTTYILAHTHTHTHMNTHVRSDTHMRTHTHTTVPTHALTFTQDSEENKLVYTEVFAKYTELLESIIETRLRQAVPGFDMQVRAGLEQICYGTQIATMFV